MRSAPPEVQVQIESLDHDARGVGRIDGKVVFVDDALPGETVMAQVYRKKPSYNLARTSQVLRSSWMRVKPRCAHYGVCGGCSMQHLDAGAQVAVKQRLLEDAFGHLGSLHPEQILAPIYGPFWGYRFRARLTVRYVARKGEVLVGFHERKSSYVADMTSCEVLPRQVSDLLVPLRRLVESLSITERLPQIEVAVGTDTVALVLRHLEPLTDEDLDKLRQFGATHQIQWWLQPKGPDTVHLLEGLSQPELAYTLPEFGVRMPFRPTDFTQVNHQINQRLVARALALLEPGKGDRVLDLFCGLGNFTLPMARISREVIGIEGSQALVDRALDNAERNGLSNTRFEARNLFDMTPQDLVELGRFDRVLIDPPREGAVAVCEALVTLTPEQRPARIVYVSCNPATLARDAAILHHKGGYQLRAAGVINMFPHTGHVESIAVFE